jgi:hypothetical protein
MRTLLRAAATSPSCAGAVGGSCRITLIMKIQRPAVVIGRFIMIARCLTMHVTCVGKIPHVKGFGCV